MSNIIRAIFNNINDKEVFAKARYQYDYGMVLRFEGAVTLPSAYEVHFALARHGEAITQIGNSEGVSVPDALFLAGKTIYAWAYLHSGEDDGYTEYMVQIPVIKRAQPSDEVPTPVQQSAIDQAIAALGVAVEQTAADVETTTANAESAQASEEAAAASAAEAAETAENVEENVTAARAAKAAAETAATTATQKASASATSADTATTKATAAANSASAAATSATNAASSASDANTSASTATSAKNTAVSKASEATTAASTATTKASEASASATAAAGSATTASTKASEAAASATTASTAASTATTKAGEAATSATNAAASAQSVASSAAQITQNAEDIDALKEDLSTLNTEGTVPTSEQMLSENYTEDSVPYHFRMTASDNADREELEIVGGSVAWNQLAVLSEGVVKPNAASRSFDSTTGIYTLEATNLTTTNFGFYVTAGTTREGHKILFSAKLNPDSALTNIKMGIGTATSKSITIPASTYTTVSVIANADSYGTLICYTNISQLSLSSLTMLVKDVQIIDLTQALTPTIADHIYSLEQATAGAGVALFKSLFPKDYYAYDSGSMQSVSGLSAHRTVGFNVWDEEGEWVTRNGMTCIWTKNYIPVLPNTEYCFTVLSSTYPIKINQYDENKTLISTGDQSLIDHKRVITTSSRTAYLLVGFNGNYGNVYKNDICINISDASKNGTYVPYDGHSYPLDDSLTLRGIPTLVDGKIKWDGDVYTPSGKVTRRFGIVDLGTLNWALYNLDTSGHSFYVSIPANCKAIKNNNLVANILCAKYATTDFANIADWEPKDKVICQVTSTERFIIRDSAYSNAATFKTAMSGVYLVYPLATPTTEQADPYIGIQSCDPNGTEEFVSTGIVPVGHVTKYPDNLRMKLDNLPWNFANLIAPTESGYTATRNYTTGALLIVNNVLYKATANIANGGTITPNTNVTATTLAEVIAALS